MRIVMTIFSAEWPRNFWPMLYADFLSAKRTSPRQRSESHAINTGTSSWRVVLLPLEVRRRHAGARSRTHACCESLFSPCCPTAQRSQRTRPAQRHPRRCGDMSTRGAHCAAVLWTRAHAPSVRGGPPCPHTAEQQQTLWTRHPTRRFSTYLHIFSSPPPLHCPHLSSHDSCLLLLPLGRLLPAGVPGAAGGARRHQRGRSDCSVLRATQ